MNKFFGIDIETNGHLEGMLDYSSFPYKLKKTAKLWCVVVRNFNTGESFRAVKEDITKEWLQNTLKDCTHLVAHNGIKFDFITLKLFGILDYTVGYLNQKDTIFGKEVTLVDTLILSRLFNPDRFGGHSLAAWGVSLGEPKTDLRAVYIEKNLLDKKAEVGAEFKIFSDEMVDYCEQDVYVNALVLEKLLEEVKNYPKWKQAIRLEHKLADLAVRREHFGFAFNREKAIECVKDLTNKIDSISNKINPILPERKLNKGEINFWTPPAIQLKKDNTPSAALQRFVERINAKLTEENNKWFLVHGERKIELPYYKALKKYIKATIEDMDTVKEYLIDLGWIPSEWNERDLTKDAKKKNLSYKKRVETLDRWLDETFKKKKYKDFRLEEMDFKTYDEIRDDLIERLKDNRPVRVRTSPPVKVGVERELCPNLKKLGKDGIIDQLEKLSDKELHTMAKSFNININRDIEDVIEDLVEEENLSENPIYIEKIQPKLKGSVLFAKDFADYLTYRYRRAAIAGGDLDEVNLNNDRPDKGYLATYREADGRIATPAIEIGAVSNRYIHKNVVNIPRTTSLYGKEMRQLFGAGEGFIQLGYDFSSLEARISGHYVFPYIAGKELAEMFAAPKPNDLHTVMGIKLGIPRGDAKFINFAILYGAQPKKISKMLAVSVRRAKELYNEFWAAVPALKELRDSLKKFWEDTGNKFIRGIDGRKIYARSPHSLINFLFQSGGVICAKYTNVLFWQKIEEMGYNIDPFEGRPDLCEMISYHDEVNMAINPKLFKFKTFKSEEEGKEFIKKWDGDKLSALSVSENGKLFYVNQPNDITHAISEAIWDVEEIMNLNVDLDFEYQLGNSWADCH